MSSPKISLTELYERDYYGWIREQVRALREHRIEEVDFENVAEEIEDLGKSESRSVESHLETLLAQLLKLSYAKALSRERNARSWENTIELARSRIRRLLNESPSLRPGLGHLCNSAYESARISARRALGFPQEPLPEASPWTLEQVMDDSFLPKATQ
jgi:hypothetical protein